MDYIFAAVWYVLGLWGFIWWWTQDNDLTSSDTLLMLWAGLVGPGT